VGPYPVWGMWFPNRLMLERIGSYPDFFVVIDDPWYPGYKTPTILYFYYKDTT
jgi:hypothetical protein